MESLKNKNQKTAFIKTLNFLPQLLVNNKIISLDLSVAEVYKKVWCPTNEVRLFYC